MSEIVVETYSPFENQKKFHTCSRRNKLYGGAMGGGKSRTLCEEVNRLMIKYPGNRGFLGRKHFADFKLSTYLTLTEKTLGSLIKYGKVIENKQDKCFRYWNGSVLYYGGIVSSGKQDEKLFSTEFGVIAIDEAFEMMEDEFKKLGTRLRHSLPNGNFPQYYFLLASNPSQNWLKTRFILNPGSQDAFIPALPKDNLYNPDDYVSQLYELFNGDMKMVSAFIEGSWDSIGDPDQLVTMDEVAKCINNRLVNVDYGSIRRYVSNDCGGMGDDQNVIYDWISSRYNNKTYYKITNTDVRSGQDHMMTVALLQQHREMTLSNAILVDPIGEGGGIASRLREIFRESPKIRVVDVDFRRTAIEETRFQNVRAESYWMLKHAIKDQRISLPDDHRIHSQLCAIKWKPIGGSKGVKIAIIPKDEIKKEIGCSPDFSDNCAIGVYGEQYVEESKNNSRDMYSIKDDAGFKPRDWRTA